MIRLYIGLHIPIEGLYPNPSAKEGFLSLIFIFVFSFCVLCYWYRVFFFLKRKHDCKFFMQTGLGNNKTPCQSLSSVCSPSSRQAGIIFTQDCECHFMSHVTFLCFLKFTLLVTVLRDHQGEGKGWGGLNVVQSRFSCLPPVNNSLPYLSICN